LVTSTFAFASLKYAGNGNGAQTNAKKVGYSDSHAHLDSYPTEELKKVLAKMKGQNVTLVLNESINLLTSAESIKIAQANDAVYAAVGIHPGEAIPLTAEVKKKLEELSGQKKVVAFGEIGLNYGSSTGSNEEQKQLLLYQVSLANNLHIPIDVHCSYGAYKECIGLVKGSNGIMHGFAGSMADLNDWLKIGYYISIGKSVLSTGSSGGSGSMGGMPEGPSLTEELIRAIPKDRLVTETDCMALQNSRWDQLGKSRGGPGGPPGGGQPGQSDARAGIPPPVGGQGAPAGGPRGAMAMEESNGPADVVKVVEKIAAIRGISTAEMADIATNNLKQVLKIK